MSTVAVTQIWMAGVMLIMAAYAIIAIVGFIKRSSRARGSTK
jgi:hypothetical protein